MPKRKKATQKKAEMMKKRRRECRECRPPPPASQVQPVPATVAPPPPLDISPPVHPSLPPPPHTFPRPSTPPSTTGKPQPSTLLLPRPSPSATDQPQPSTSFSRPPRPSPLVTEQPQPSTSSTSAPTRVPDKVTTPYDLRRKLMKDRQTVVTDIDDNKKQLQFSLEDIRRLLDIAACTACFAPLSLNAKTDCLSSKLTVTCTSCENGVVLRDETAMTSTGELTTLQENNVKAVFEALYNDIGVTGLNRIVSTLGYDTFSQVQKEECVNHVSKRLGTRLRKLKKELVTTITTRTGKEVRRSVLSGRGQLTDNAINKVTCYFSRAVRGDVDKPYTSTQDMRKNILASYYHAVSTDVRPQHSYCPPGLDSWCFYRRGEADRTKPCRNHSQKPGYFSKIPFEHRQAILNVYTELTHDDLLKRCMKGETQNRNESLHSKLWMKAAKHKFVGLRRVNFVAQVVILDHNFGFEEAYFPRHLGFKTAVSKSANLQFLQKEYCRSVTPKKTARRKKKSAAGSSDYCPGGF
ncbi:hypothetical protein Pcinc_031463 [Petrolisthes cinctipes]|uniref:Mutator-like transposase domain-containing protein n=1 Tax=Petrolisthes cinctipes TaxID=88211 RepID=A0AAE1EWK8_PETCI|nr:hypothetical protein Pcinc_031463 [Petrolisthes cinctipes]